MNTLNGSVSGETSQEVVVVGKDEFTYQQATAIYQEVRGKGQNLRGSSIRAFILQKQDIAGLSRRLLDVFRKEYIDEHATKIFVDFSAASGVNFDNISDFLECDKHTSSPICTLNFDLSFLVRDRQRRTVSSFSIDLYLRSRAHPNNSTPEQIFFEYDVPFFNFSAFWNIRFHDYELARLANSTIEDWVRNLPTVEGGFFKSKIITVAAALQYIGHIFTLFLFAAAGFFFIRVIFPGLGEDFEYHWTILFSVSLMFIGNKIANTIGSKLRVYLTRMQNVSHIKITRGDDEIAAKQQKKSENAVFYFLGTVSLQIILGIISTYLSTVFL